MNQEISEEERQAIIARERAEWKAIVDANAKLPPPTPEQRAENHRLSELARAQEPEHLRTELMKRIVKK